MKFHAIALAYISLSTVLSAQVVPAQPEVLSASQVRAIGGAVPALLSGPSSTGKEVFFANGIQGEIRIAGTIGVDGSMHSAAVVTSSRSSELDAFALGLITNSKFEPGKDKAGEAIPVRVTIPVYLWKDSLADGTLFSKLCGDFVVDADWHAQAFPEEQPSQLRSWLMASGASVAYNFTHKRKPTKVPDFRTVYDACRGKPSRKFFEVFVSP